MGRKPLLERKMDRLYKIYKNDKMKLVRTLSDSMDSSNMDIFDASEVLVGKYPDMTLEGAVDLLIDYRTEEF
jgi:hypothetical protein